MAVEIGSWRCRVLLACSFTAGSLAGLAPSPVLATAPTPSSSYALSVDHYDPSVSKPAHRGRLPQSVIIDQQQGPQRHITLTIGGDLGFGGSREPVVATAGRRKGRAYPHDQLTRHLRPYLMGDLAFANLETVVTTSNSLPTQDKAFNFRMHPEGVGHLIQAGFNVLSTANNHSIDYGSVGMRDTLRHMEALKGRGLIAAHGVGATLDDVVAPARFSAKEASFAFSAVGIGGIAPSASSPGQVHPNSKEGFERVVSSLGASDAAFRFLSVHYGQELQVRPSTADRAKLADVISNNRVDLVIGHHAHTPAGVERVGDGFVFYGLGNLLHLGMQTMDKFGPCRDFGILARLHLTGPAEGGRLTARAIEVFTLTDMNIGARVRQGEDGRRRIDVLNYLGSELNATAGAGRGGVTFQKRGDGSGLYCSPDAAKLGGPVGKLCAEWKPPEAPATATQRRLATACRFLRKSGAMARAPALRETKAASANRQSRRGFAAAAFEPDN